MTTRPVEDQLRAALGAAAAEIRVDPTAYRRASAAWRRRERRRRLILAVLAAVVFVAADAVGLWALSQADPNTHVIFSEPGGPATPDMIDRTGQP
ncbi:MAG: hypothetical protein L0H84_14680 [Pseudonocardia sp.]|nr:hypothetical protein [Pseudonocardia sp.]